MANEIYSDNKLVNGDAETGDLTGWEDVANVDVVAGGAEEGSSYCFEVSQGGSMSQTITPGIQPPDNKIIFAFLPAEDPPLEAKEVKAYVKVEHEYADGTTDEFILPAQQEIVDFEVGGG